MSAPIAMIASGPMHKSGQGKNVPTQLAQVHLNNTYLTLSANVV